MKAEGIEFKTNTLVGKDYSGTTQREFHAIVLAMGSTVPRNLPIPNRDAKGVYFAMEYLRQNKKSKQHRFYRR